jgi:histone acetyltransferase (RNA polymerase elongator complex component)
MSSTCFFHPLLSPSSRRILPFFLPYIGCAGHCLYCSQHSQTGIGPRSLEHSFDILREMLEQRLLRDLPRIDVGFFGGTFTALPLDWQKRFLQLLAPYRERNVVDRIRCSTRPDAVGSGVLERLRELGMDTIELGIQSFDEEVLTLSGRGYTREQALDACCRVLNAGFELTIQLLPGLPGHGPAHWEEDITAVCLLGPAGVRIYPCLVLRATGLAELWEQGGYAPWSLEETVERLASGVTRLARYNIPTIRMGLTPEREMLDDILAGPWHPALGFLVRSRAVHTALHAQILTLSSPPRQLMVPRKHLPEVIGHRGQGRSALIRLGLPPDGIVPWDLDHFLLLSTDHPGVPPRHF